MVFRALSPRPWRSVWGSGNESCRSAVMIAEATHFVVYHGTMQSREVV